jgi:hypothetical protein
MSSGFPGLFIELTNPISTNAMKKGKTKRNEIIARGFVISKSISESIIAAKALKIETTPKHAQRFAQSQ